MRPAVSWSPVGRRGGSADALARLDLHDKVVVYVRAAGAVKSTPAQVLAALYATSAGG